MNKDIFTKLSENKKKLAAILFSVFSNILALLTASVVGFFLPRFTSVDTYAQYRIFSIFYSYLGFFHLGFVDGINLKYGGFDYKNLPKKRFRMISRFLFCFMSITQFMLCFGVIVLQGKEALSSPILMAFICLVPSVFNTYFAFIEQFTKRFFIDGIAQIIQNAIIITGFGAFIILGCDNYLYYIAIMIVTYLSAFFYHVLFNKEIIFGEAEKIIHNLYELRETIARGFFIMISQFISIFIVTFDGLIVKMFLQTSDFAMYTFSASVVTFMFQLTAIISKIIFPYLKRIRSEEFPTLYEKMKIYVLIFASSVAGFSLFFMILIPIIIPNYTGSLYIIRILGGSVIFKGVQELVCGNFFKVLDSEKSYAKVNFFALILSIVLDLVVFYYFKNPSSVAIASVVTFAFWLCSSDIVLRRKMGIKHSYSYYLMIFIVFLYYLCVFINAFVGVVVYYIVIVSLTIFVLRKYPLLNNKVKNHIGK